MSLNPLKVPCLVEELSGSNCFLFGANQPSMHNCYFHPGLSFPTRDSPS